MSLKNMFEPSTVRAREKGGRRFVLAFGYLLLIFGIGASFCLATSAGAKEPAKSYTETLVSEIGEKMPFEMNLVPGGTFVMGSPAGEVERRDDEGPQHKVQLKPFYICTTETTIQMFMAYYEETVSAKRDLIGVQQPEKKSGKLDGFTGPTPVFGDMTMGYDDNHPAMGMTWENAVNFCKWLSIKTGKQYRLPTEAEWEYACRAGSDTCFACGDDPKQIDDFAWHDGNSDFETHPIGSKKPNAWGLHDMMGNVREWVHDFYSPTAYADAAKDSPVVDPKGPATGKVHVARGSDYTNVAIEMRSAARTFEEDWWRSGDPQIPKSVWWLPEMDFIGIRVVRSVDDKPQAEK